MSNQAPCIRMVLFRVWAEGRRQRKTPGAEALGVLVREAGLEPARPEWTLEPESSESANSTTRAYRFPDCWIIIARRNAVVNLYFSTLQKTPSTPASAP